MLFQRPWRMIAASDLLARAAEVAKPQRMRGVTLRVEATACADLLQPLANDAGRQPASADAPSAVDGPKQRSADQTAGRQPRLERAHRTGVRIRAVQHGDFLERALLVGLGAAQAQHHPFRLEPNVADVEPDELAAPQRPGEANEQQRPIAPVDAAVATRCERRSELTDEQRGLGPRRDPALPADPGQGGPHHPVGGRRLVSGRPMHHGDRGQLAPQRRRPSSQVGEKEGHGLRAGRQRVDGVRGAPGAESPPIGGVGAQGGRRPGASA
jgi:hypothetical protein